jgi:hypothetical protein
MGGSQSPDSAAWTVGAHPQAWLVLGAVRPVVEYVRWSGCRRRYCHLVHTDVVYLLQDFNRHLDTLTEHYDIPKVSWTK